ncbi:hypothetical protein K7G98_13350 [Saccharothrix sp. MB29]|nr:hypothetical protein [Saccharothrix sp. MB29]
MEDDDPNAEECDRTFGFDFENYIIAAINGRANHDYITPTTSGSRRGHGSRLGTGLREKNSAVSTNPLP